MNSRRTQLGPKRWLRVRSKDSVNASTETGTARLQTLRPSASSQGSSETSASGSGVPGVGHASARLACSEAPAARLVETEGVGHHTLAAASAVFNRALGRNPGNN